MNKLLFLDRPGLLAIVGPSFEFNAALARGWGPPTGVSTFFLFFLCSFGRPRKQLAATAATVAMGVKRTKEKKKADKPSLDKTALAQLTSKIDKSLADSEKERPPKRKRQRETDEGQEPKRRQTQPSDSKPHGDSSGGKQKKQANALLDEILALGGNEDDLELVANVDSGDEGGAPRPKVSSEPGVDKSLKDELAQFASSLGFSKFQAEDPATDEESEDVEESDAAEEEVEEEEEPSSESEEEEEVVEKEITKAVMQPQEARQGKKAGQPVSKQFCTV